MKKNNNNMKKNFFCALGMAVLLCSCGGNSVVEEGNRMAASGFVGGLGNVTTSMSFYDFTEDEPGCEYTGFSGKEGFGRWTEGEESSMVFENIVPGSEVTAKIMVSMATPAGEAAKYEAFVNDQYICSGETFPGPIYVNIPSNVIGDNDVMTLVLKHKNPKRPIDVNPNNYDSRLLGMGIRNVTLIGYALNGENEEEEND